jgi:hypothetical protein
MRTHTDPINCTSCGRDDLLTVTFDAEGTMVLFRVCSHCEARWWERDGATLDLPSVLPLVAR